MEILEININGETYVSLSEPLAEHIDTQIVEPNIYGKALFLKNDNFYHFSISGPILVEKKEMIRILNSHEEQQ